MTDHVLEEGVLAIAEAVKTGRTTAVDVLEEVVRRVSVHETGLHCFQTLMLEQARAAAEKVDEAVGRGQDPGPLAGVPIALKDNLCTVGVPTTCSSKILEGWEPPYNATVVDRLREAGAIAIGKTNLDEFAMGSSTENSAFGTTRNPWDPSRVPGGSSGGTAAAVASGMVATGLGSDTGGSIRQPASLCGVVGIKPTYGLVSRYGLVAFASSLDQIGTFAPTVADAAAALEVIAGHDPMDSTSIAAASPSLVAGLSEGIEGLRVGLIADFLNDVSPACAKATDDAGEALAAAGAKVESVSIPEMLLGLPAYYIIAPAEASSNLARYDGVRYGLRVDGPDAATMNARTRAAGFGAEVRRRIMIGTYALSAGYYDAYYGQALRARTLMIRAFDTAYANFDVLLAPTTPSSAFKIGEKTANPIEMYLSDLCTIPSNLSGHPAVSVPFALDELGLPIGVQVLAPALGEAVMLRVAAAIEAAAPRSAAARSSRERSPSVPEGYETVIGLEVHCELSTKTKLFCGCANSFGSEPNTNICPVCLGLPGSLPVLNRRAVEFAMRIGEALNCEIKRSIFHRKNYFYPDMPKDYQISQYDEPINVNGHLDLPDGSVVRIERAHIEEDTGKTTHLGGTGGRIHGADYSLVDYNRAGVPLVEIVSAPDMRSAQQARAYVAELRAILVATGASDGRMEEGSLRVDANVSVRPIGSEEYGTRCEVKNMNSLRSLVKAIDHEAERQVRLVSSGGRVTQETRHFDENEGRTHSLRSKEEAYDYRYFPEPDLVPVVPDEGLLAAARQGVGVLPAERRRRMFDVVGDDGTAEQVQTVIELDLDSLVLAAVSAGADPRLALARTANEAAAKAEGAAGLDVSAYVALLGLESSGKLSATQSKTVLGELIDSGGDPVEISRRLGFEAMDSSELDSAVNDVIAANPAEWERYVAGDPKVTQFLLGQVMKATKGRANGKLVAEAFAARAGT